MSFWNKAFEFGKKAAVHLAEEGQKAQARAQQQTGKTMAEQERQLQKYESIKHKMSDEQRAKLEKMKETHEQKKRILSDKGVHVSAGGELKYGDYTYRQWDGKWQSIGLLASANLTPYNSSVGLYRHKVNGDVVYIGRAVELHNGGFRKRLSDYRRESDSARKHTSGQLINENLSSISTDILVVGNTDKDITITKELEKVFVGTYSPKWNRMLK